MNKITQIIKNILSFLASWKRAIIVILLALIFLYYPIGGHLISQIDRSTDVDILPEDPAQSAAVETLSYLINREVNQKLWTPNLPIIFPSYFLDNMPNYQLGIIEAAAKFTNALSQKIGAEKNLKTAAELLSYNGRTWMFNPTNSLLPAPSANSQFRKGRKELIHFNNSLEAGTEIFIKKPLDLAYLLRSINKDLSSSAADLEIHIRENQTNWFDLRADDIFYFNQGKLHAYYFILKSLGIDYKDIILEFNLYEDFIKALKALETASTLDPWLVRNANLNSVFAANHLSYLGYYNLKAQNTIAQIIAKLN